MAPTLVRAFSHFFTLAASLSMLHVVPSSCFNPRKIVNASLASYGSDWSSAVATWYGPAQGDGSEGGACGYGSSVGEPPFSSLISAGSPLLYESGKGCGSCYEVKCTGNYACSGNPVRVVITDECPGCGSDSQYHFDLSGSAFGAMAVSGQDQKLRNAGKINIQYRRWRRVSFCRVECNYGGVSIAFRVDTGSNQEYFAMVIEFEGGDGDLEKVELKEALDSAPWYTMQRSWGAVWKLDKGSPLNPPFSIRLTTVKSVNTVVASNVIPKDWTLGQTYRSIRFMYLFCSYKYSWQPREVTTPSDSIVNASIDSHSSDSVYWSSAFATWYGPDHGDGSEAGACGYGSTVGVPPLSSMITAGSYLLFQSGKGCGSCYEVKCTGNKACSGKPVRVVMTDLCPECGSGAHFDMSGTSFSAMAAPGQDNQLRIAGQVAIQYRRYMSVAFHVDSGSNQLYFAVMVEYEDGDGEIDKVEVKEACSKHHSRSPSWGAVWKLSKGSRFKARVQISANQL
ncbi:unnamed protein product [Sphenostylis stenocarpa]|uniref:Uncharacterized protein n=1 Tax=Sphenostylis stenocarpa TaxID=92480 RepID=A0AA86SNM0_9FABA|nr:unnamed protein product [Sphenostylis stenocarpa]